MNLTIHIEGVTPILQHNARLSDPLDPIAMALKKVTGVTKKTEEHHAEMARLEFLGSVYTMPDGHIAFNANALRRCVQDAAASFKAGKKVERGIVWPVQRVPLHFPEMNLTPEQLWAKTDKDGVRRYENRQSMRNQQSRVMRTRAQFDVWAADVPIVLDESVIEVRELERALKIAGDLYGVGDSRTRGYGKFTATLV